MNETLQTLLLFVVLGLLFYSFHKTRQIHLALFRVETDLARVKQESISLFDQIQSLDALNRLIRLQMPLPMLRGWAGSPDFLLHLARHVLQRRPSTVMECSSGASTLVIARCLQMNGSGHVYSLEHEAEYAAKTRALLLEQGLGEWATVILAPLRQVAGAPSWYDLGQVPQSLPTVDLLVVDGPPESTGPLARAPAWAALSSRMSSDCAVMLDDADRPDEQAAIAKWRQAEPGFRQSNLRAEKGCVLLERGRIAQD
jgi:hypothetical protein